MTNGVLVRSFLYSSNLYSIYQSTEKIALGFEYCEKNVQRDLVWNLEGLFVNSFVRQKETNYEGLL